MARLSVEVVLTKDKSGGIFMYKKCSSSFKIGFYICKSSLYYSSALFRMSAVDRESHYANRYWEVQGKRYREKSEERERIMQSASLK